MAYWEWGDPDNDNVLLCVHGLTRSGRDFDRLARRLAPAYRVVFPDVVGRGYSDWFLNPAHYTVPQYVADMVTLVARLRPAALHWLGTSMGGLIGMAFAGTAALSATMQAARQRAGERLPSGALRVSKMVLNDVGPRLSLDALVRIGDYVGQPVTVDSFDAAVDYVRQVSSDFGPHSDEEWRELARYVFKEQDGRWTKHYDLGMAAAFDIRDETALAAAEQMLWRAYEAIDAPILVLRGEMSDLLSRETAAEMVRRNPRARVTEIPGVGHAPTLMHDAQIALVEQFLLDK
jgi:pimeloyl-ACP methyl ester carboxylesterase